jgi:chromosome segregation ATPase
MRRRPKHIIEAELAQERERLEQYLAREKEMLSPDGVQLYTIGSRNLQRYQTSLTALQDQIEKLRKRIRELENELAGNTARRAVGITPHDW